MKDDNVSNNHFSASDICRILKECRRSGVKEFISPGIQFTLFSEGPDFSESNNAGASLSGYQVPLSSNDRLGDACHSDPQSPLVESQPQVGVNETVESIIEDERLLNLPIEDPWEWETRSIKEMDSAETEHRGSSEALQ